MIKFIFSLVIIFSFLSPATSNATRGVNTQNRSVESVEKELQDEMGSLWWLAQEGAVITLYGVSFISTSMLFRHGKEHGGILGGAEMRLTSVLLMGGATVALAVYFVSRYGSDVKEFLFSQADKDLLEKHFVDMKVAKAQWEVSPENPFLKSNYLVEKKLYQEKTLELAVLSGFEGRREVLDQIENQILETESELLNVDETIAALSSQETKTFLAAKGEQFDQEEQRVEIAQRYREALATLEGKI